MWACTDWDDCNDVCNALGALGTNGAVLMTSPASHPKCHHHHGCAVGRNIVLSAVAGPAVMVDGMCCCCCWCCCWCCYCQSAEVWVLFLGR